MTIGRIAGTPNPGPVFLLWTEMRPHVVIRPGMVNLNGKLHLRLRSGEAMGSIPPKRPPNWPAACCYEVRPRER